MRYQTTVAVFLMVVMLSGAVSAAEARLVDGAGTLPQGDQSISLALLVLVPRFEDEGDAYRFPVPGYSVDYHYGLSERFQLGLTGAYYGGLRGIAGVKTKYRLFESKNGSNLLSVHLAPRYFHFSDDRLVWLDPTLLLEHRWGEKRTRGVFVKAGTVHGIDLAPNSGNDTITTIQAGLGYQHQFGKNFSLSAELGVAVNPNKKSDINIGVVPTGRIGLNWAF